MPNDQVYGLTDHFIKSIAAKLVKAMEGKVVEGVSDDGAVRLEVSGKHRALRAKTSAGDTVATEQAIVSAVNDALAKWEKLAKGELKKLVGNLPVFDD
jgi:DNA-binding protein YbaB